MLLISIAWYKTLDLNEYIFSLQRFIRERKIIKRYERCVFE